MLEQSMNDDVISLLCNYAANFNVCGPTVDSSLQVQAFNVVTC